MTFVDFLNLLRWYHIAAWSESPVAIFSAVESSFSPFFPLSFPNTSSIAVRDTRQPSPNFERVPLPALCPHLKRKRLDTSGGGWIEAIPERDQRVGPFLCSSLPHASIHEPCKGCRRYEVRVVASRNSSRGNRDRLLASIEAEIILGGRSSLCRTSMSTCRRSAWPPPWQGGEDGLSCRLGRRHGIPSRLNALPLAMMAGIGSSVVTCGASISIPPSSRWRTIFISMRGSFPIRGGRHSIPHSGSLVSPLAKMSLRKRQGVAHLGDRLPFSAMTQHYYHVDRTALYKASWALPNFVTDNGGNA